MKSLRPSSFLLLCVLCVFVSSSPSRAGDIVRVDARADERGRSIGIRVDLVGALRARRPTRKVYVEEAVALWRPAPGEQVAAAGSVEAQDVNAAVLAKETERPQTWKEIAAGHLARNAGRYIAGAALVAIGAGGYAIYDANKGGDAPAAAKAAEPTNRDSQNYQPANSPTVAVTAGDNSPVNVNVSVTAMPPE
ncbi:MAG: hypothetical protein KJ579_01800 [Verrucomicrobia bacterium]|nr:hypothetical protein [Verrucomicrobiota bacterium]